MKVTLINHTPDPEKLIAASAKLCYSDTGCEDLMNDLSDEKTKNFIEMLMNIGHESPIEHVSFTFAIEGVSRTLLAQITRHRHASFSVQSQRYVRKDNFIFVTPPAIENDPIANELYQKAMRDSYDTYNSLADMLCAKYEAEYIAANKPENEAHKDAEKKAIEDARFVLPNACETKMVVTMNTRSLYNFFKLRCCNRAQWEIRDLATEMYRLCCQVAPSLFKNAGPACVTTGKCPEGKMTCGKATEIKTRFEGMRNGIS